MFIHLINQFLELKPIYYFIILYDLCRETKTENKCFVRQMSYYSVNSLFENSLKLSFQSIK